LTTEIFYQNWWFIDQVNKFNLENENIRIEIIPYYNDGDYFDYTTGRVNDTTLKKLITDIIAGEAPDIIDVSVFPMRNYANKGLFVDLYPYIDADPELSRGDILPNVLTALEIDGHLYQTLSSFWLHTAFGRSDMVGDDIGWTLDEALAAQPDYGKIFRVPREDLLPDFLCMYAESFVDWDAGTCDFESREFIRLLEILKATPSAADLSQIWYDKAEVSYREKEYLLHIRDFMMFRDCIPNMKSYFGGGGFTFKGYPTSSGSGNFIKATSNTNLAILSTCNDTDAAWEFARTMFTEEYQSTMTIGMFCSNVNVFEQRLNRQLESIDKEITEADVERFRELINSSARLYITNPALTGIILDELPAYFAGDKSVGETARLIQGRASLYVGEQK
jgi:ABC-type glycerol-3-phosphate transport system substrate-binding protein